MLNLKLKERHTDGKNLNKLRDQDLIPGVIGFTKKPSIPVMVSRTELEKISEMKNEVLNISGLDNKAQAMLIGLQRDPVRHKAVHFSLHALEGAEELERTVPLVMEGQPAWIKPFHTVQMPIDEITVKGDPRKIPNTITIDITEMEEGEVIHGKDLKLEKGLSVVDDDMDKALVTITAQTFKEEEPVAETDEPMEVTTHEDAAEEANEDTTKA